MTSKEGIKHIPKDVLAMLEKKTGLGSAEAWSNILSLIGKSEHDDIRWWLSEKGDSVYAYRNRLSYDGSERGCTIGLVGFTTHADGKPVGDAQELFAEYKQLGGRDLAPLAKDAHKKEGVKDLYKAIDEIGDDPRWVQAQWKQLFSKGGSGYIYETLNICKKRGIDTPSALAFAVIFDCAMNHGATGNEGARAIADKVPDSVKDEKAFLKKFLEIRKPIAAGPHDYNSPPINGTNRCKQFQDLLEADCLALVDCDALIKKVTSWEMK